jgi:hypothetical protein
MTITDQSHVSTLLAARPTRVPPLLIPIAAAIFAIAGFGPNITLAIFALAVLIAGAALLWRPGEAPILLFIFGYHWIEISISIFSSNIFDESVAYFVSWNGQQERAIVLSLIGLLLLAAGMRYGAGPWRHEVGERLRRIVVGRTVGYWFRLYVIVAVISFFAVGFSWFIPGLRQPMLALGNFKWAFFWLLAYATFIQPRAPKLFLLSAFGYEFILALGGFFSDFKTVVFYTIFALLASGLKFSRKAMLGIVISGLLVIILGVGWSAIKTPLRQAFAPEQQGQVATISFADRLRTVGDLVSNVDADLLRFGVQALVARVSYVEFFGVVLNTVPAVMPHTDGTIWRDAATRPFMPRLFFPDKPIIDDTERTFQYTNGLITLGSAITSISIGYFTEAYIDFGQYGMMIPIALLGLLYGRIYRWLLRRGDRFAGFGSAAATVVLFNGFDFGWSITKILGGIAVSALVAWAIMRFVAPVYLTRAAAGQAR